MNSADHSSEFKSLLLNAASESAQISNEVVNKKLYLSSKSQPSFKIQIDAKTIQACEILRSVSTFTETPDSDAIEVDMSPKQLCKFVKLHQHFSLDDPWDKEEPEWICKFFGEFSDSEFKEFCWKADYLDSERFLNNAAIYLHKKLELMEVEEFRELLNIIDDYSDAEKSAFFDCYLGSLVDLSMGEKVPFHPQNFDLPKPLINFAFSAEKIPWNLILKLYSTCKYFFGTLKLIPCSKVLILNRINLFHSANNGKHISLDDMTKLKIEHLATKEFAHHNLFFSGSCDQLLKKIMPTFLSAFKLSHHKLTMTLKEFEFLCFNVDEFIFYHVKVVDSDGRMVPVEELLKCLPKVTKFQYINSSPDCFTPKTMQNLTALKRNVKFSIFSMTGPESLRIAGDHDFEMFVKNHENPTVQSSFRIEDWSGNVLFEKNFIEDCKLWCFF